MDPKRIHSVDTYRRCETGSGTSPFFFLFFLFFHGGIPVRSLTVTSRRTSRHSLDVVVTPAQPQEPKSPPDFLGGGREKGGPNKPPKGNTYQQRGNYAHPPPPHDRSALQGCATRDTPPLSPRRLATFVVAQWRGSERALHVRPRREVMGDDSVRRDRGGFLSVWGAASQQARLAIGRQRERERAYTV